MTVKVKGVRSDAREVWGGCPQGSIPVVFLFNSTIDDLEEGCSDIAESGTGVEEKQADENQDEDEDDEDFSPVTLTPETNPTVSTALLNSQLFDPTESPICGSFLARSRRGKKKPCKLNITAEMAADIPPEPNTKTEAKWREKLAALLRFIDDGFFLIKINFENSFGFQVNSICRRLKHAVKSQNVFHHLVRRAEEIGMVVNSSKTALICVSDAQAYMADAYILDSDGPG